MEVPIAEDGMVQKTWNYILGKLPKFNISKFNAEQLLAGKAQSQRKRVARALDNLKRFGWSMNDAVVRMFIKFEKAPDDPSDPPEGKAPRCIQHRSYEYTTRLAQYLMPLEHKVWNWNRDFKKAPVEERFFAKKLNSFERARRIVAMDRFPNTVFLLLDHSRFDAHLTLDKLGMEFAFYRRFIKSSEFDALLDCQVKNICYGRSGIKYLSLGRKMSGEYNTSLGDSLINMFMLAYWIREIDGELFVDGDDSVVAIDSSSIRKLDFNYWKRMGMNTKIEQTALLEEVEFCQCRPVKLSGGYRMVRNPDRVMSRSPYTIHTFNDSNSYRKWLASVAAGEYACNEGVPILQEYAFALGRAAGVEHTKGMLGEVLARRPGEHFHGYNKRPISLETRRSFHLAWGISPTVQLDIEKNLLTAGPTFMGGT